MIVILDPEIPLTLITNSCVPLLFLRLSGEQSGDCAEGKETYIKIHVSQSSKNMSKKDLAASLCSSGTLTRMCCTTTPGLKPQDCEAER